MNTEHPFLDKCVNPKLSKITLNLTTGESEKKILIHDMPLEFPVINQDLMGYKNRYTYLVRFASEPAKSGMKFPNDSQMMKGFVKYDMQEEKIAGYIPFGDTRSAGEVFFNAKDNAKTEDDGYCMAFVFDWSTN